jgi:hypothetical protein
VANTLYVTSWSVPQHPAYVGADPQRRRWTVMAYPAQEQRGRGRVPLLIPPAHTHDDLRALVAARGGGRPQPDREQRYREELERGWRSAEAAGAFVRLRGVSWRDGECVDIRAGDVLLCGCGLEAAREGGCHRTWFAPFLARAGWDVVLDGQRTTPMSSRSSTR